MNHLLTNNSFSLIEKEGLVTLYEGEIKQLNTLKELERLHVSSPEIIFMNPYCSIKEKGFNTHGEDKIRALVVKNKSTFTKEELIKKLPKEEVETSEITASISDEVFTEQVANIQANEIATGNATQVILSRYFQTTLRDFSETKILSLYAKSLQQAGQYMTILFADKSTPKTTYFIGTPPERHVYITKETIGMTPIAGTLKKTTEEAFPQELKEFLQDEKEINELFQVLDEEIKIMAPICPKGGRVKGPLLREIGGVVHTEYELEGARGNHSLIDILINTLHAPTLIGGPLKSAARIIHRHETESRRYYGGEIGILKNDTLDSAIMIRCAEVDGDGNIRVQAGAGIVSGSVPEKECEETRAKATVFLRLLKSTKTSDRFLTPVIQKEIEPILKERNKRVSKFLFSPQEASNIPDLQKNITIINNEDDFAEVIAHIVHHLGYKSQIIDTPDFDAEQNDSDLIILGPGPGDINDLTDPKMKKLESITKSLFEKQTPLLGICLGHQSILKNHGYKICQQEICTQGVQKEIDVFGAFHKVGFYNSFAPEKDKSPILTFSKDHHIGLQFHPESVMTPEGSLILQECLSALTENRSPKLN